ncbi:MAG TPA: M56 family metallopeptidase, partial [Planctomycetaceae bacterium]|nr:M56 family metallopeptidase [Planctomycetaceae bacterium]
MNMLESIFAAVVDASWRGAWLIAAVLLLQWAFRRHVSARVVRWLSLALVLRLLVPFAIPGGWSPFPAHLFGSPASQAPSAPVAVEVPTVLPETAAMTPSAAVAPSARRSPLSPLPAAAMVWALGAAVLIVSRLLAAMTFAGRLRRSSRPAPAAVLAEAQRQFGSDRIRAFVTDRITAPALYGVLRPRLLFPPGLIERLGSAELRLIIAHERGHHLRRDLLMQELARFAAAVHWFNPLAWVAAARLRHACELACDE